MIDAPDVFIMWLLLFVSTANDMFAEEFQPGARGLERLL
jgi:hypothetical protein